MNRIMNKITLPIRNVRDLVFDGHVKGYQTIEIYLLDQTYRNDLLYSLVIQDEKTKKFYSSQYDTGAGRANPIVTYNDPVFTEVKQCVKTRSFCGTDCVICLDNP